MCHFYCRRKHPLHDSCYGGLYPENHLYSYYWMVAVVSGQYLLQQGVQEYIDDDELDEIL
jgi:hypothetical protein